MLDDMEGGGVYLQKNVGQAAFDEVHLFVVYRWG